MSGKQQRAAALTRWAALSPEQRRAATATATEASVAKRRTKAEREAAALALNTRKALAGMRPETLAAARRVLGPDPTDDELFRQCVLIVNARKALAEANDPEGQARERVMREAVYRSSKTEAERDRRARRVHERTSESDDRHHEEGRPACQPIAQAQERHHGQGTA